MNSVMYVTRDDGDILYDSNGNGGSNCEVLNGSRGLNVEGKCESFSPSELNPHMNEGKRAGK